MKEDNKTVFMNGVLILLLGISVLCCISVVPMFLFVVMYIIACIVSIAYSEKSEKTNYGYSKKPYYKRRDRSTQRKLNPANNGLDLTLSQSSHSYNPATEPVQAKLTNSTNQLNSEFNRSLTSDVTPLNCEANPVKVLLTDLAEHRKMVELTAMNLAMQYEEDHGRIPKDVSEENLGYDILSRENDQCIKIEVKGFSTIGNVLLTQNERDLACQPDTDYYLYVVEDCANNGSKRLVMRQDIKPEELEQQVSAYIFSGEQINRVSN